MCTFSVIIPAHNEENYIGKCLEAVGRAAEKARPLETEVTVAANLCTDRTAEIARQHGVFGDRYLIKNRQLTKRVFTGTDREAADEFCCDVR